jgi:hypothetical protein
MNRKPKPKPVRGLACPNCGAATLTLWTRPKGRVCFRRRQCPACGERVTTKETPINKAAEPANVDKALVALSMTEFLKSLGIDPTELGKPITLEPGGHDAAASRPASSRQP